MPEGGEPPTSGSGFKAVPIIGSCLWPGQSQLLAWRGFGGPMFTETKESSKGLRAQDTGPVFLQRRPPLTHPRGPGLTAGSELWR